MVLAAVLVSAAERSGQPQPAQTDERGAQYQTGTYDPASGPGTFAFTPPAPPATGAPLVVQVEPTAKEVHEEAKREAAEASIFWIKTDAWLVFLTFFLTLATTLLWLETWKLRRGADDQKTVDERARADEAKRLNEALKVSQENAKTALYQARIAEDAYKASNRPWLIIKPARGASSNREFVYTIVNYGSSPAFIREILSVLICPNSTVTEELIDSSYFSFRHSDNVIAPMTNRKGNATPPANSAPFPTGQRIFAVGKIDYEGVNGLRCMTRFCWEYAPGSQDFYETDNPPNLNRRT